MAEDLFGLEVLTALVSRAFGTTRFTLEGHLRDPEPPTLHTKLNAPYQ